MFFFIIAVLITITLLIAILTVKLEVVIENFEAVFNENTKKVKKQYKLNINLYLFNFLKFINIDLGKLRKIKNNKQFKKINQKIKNRGKKNNLKALENIIKDTPKIDIKIKKLKLDLQIGTQDAAVTSYLVAGISTFLGIILRNKINKEDKFEVMPIYTNNNIVNIKIDTIFVINIGKRIRTLIRDKIKELFINIKKRLQHKKIDYLRKQTNQIKYKLQKNVNNKLNNMYVR